MSLQLYLGELPELLALFRLPAGSPKAVMPDDPADQTPLPWRCLSLKLEVPLRIAQTEIPPIGKCLACSTIS